MGDAIQGCLAGLGCASVDWLLRADEERAAAAAAEPLPEESTWAQYQTGDGDGHFFDNGGDQLEPLLAHTTLIKAKWLLDFARGKVTLPKWRATDGSPIVPPWQDVPPEAVVSLGELRATTMDFTLPIAVLVLPWASTVHPDPSGAVLQNLVPVLRAMARSTVYGAGGPSGGSPKVWGILWDFMSYPARGYTSGYDSAVDDRTPYQLARFKRGFDLREGWYSHPRTSMLIYNFPLPEDAERSDPIESRGWCVTERFLGSISKSELCSITISAQQPSDGAISWFDFATECTATRFAPLAPPAFEAMLREGIAAEEATAGTGISFTDSSDASTACVPQYTRAFLRNTISAAELSYHACFWGHAEAKVLARSLQYMCQQGAAAEVTSLILSRNQLNDAAIAPILSALADGFLPKLEELNLDENQISDVGVSAIFSLLATRKLRLRLLSVSDNLVSDSGATLLAKSLRDGPAAAAPTLKRLCMERNPFGEAAASNLRISCACRGITFVR